MGAIALVYSCYELIYYLMQGEKTAIAVFVQCAEYYLITLIFVLVGQAVMNLAYSTESKTEDLGKLKDSLLAMIISISSVAFLELILGCEAAAELGIHLGMQKKEEEGRRRRRRRRRRWETRKIVITNKKRGKKDGCFADLFMATLLINFLVAMPRLNPYPRCGNVWLHSGPNSANDLCCLFLRDVMRYDIEDPVAVYPEVVRQIV